MSTVTISAADVNNLRKQTGAGMMDCRAALQETNGDFEAAIDYLRKKGQKVAAKRSDRDANEGVVIAKTSADHKVGIVVNLTSETDFVSKNEDFQKVGLAIADAAIANNCKTIILNNPVNVLFLGNLIDSGVSGASGLISITNAPRVFVSSTIDLTK